MPDAASTTGPTATPLHRPTKRKGRFLWFGLALVLVALAAGGGVAFLMHARAVRAKGPPLTVSAGYYDLGAIVANFTTDHAIHFLQVDVALMSHDPQALAAAKQASPQIRNALVLLLSGQKYPTLSTTQGKLQLQREALQSVQKIVRGVLGRPGIQAVYFTTFVMQ